MATESYFYSLNWDDRYQLGKIKLFSVTKDEFEKFMSEQGLVKDGYNYGYSNNNIIICISYRSVVDLDDINISIKNKKTFADLGYNSYKNFGNYIIEQFINKYCVKTPSSSKWVGNKIKLNSYTAQDSEDFKKFFYDEFKKAIKVTNDRMNLKNKKDRIKDKVQNIENEIDFAIIEMGEEVKSHGLYFEQCKPDVAAASLVYRFEVFLKGAWGRLSNNWGNPYVTIRKLKTGKYTMTWRLMDSSEGESAKWHKIDDNITPNEIKQFLRDYFQEWYDMNLNRTNVKTPSWAKV